MNKTFTLRVFLLSIILPLFLIITSICSGATSEEVSVKNLRPLLIEKKYDDIIKKSLIILYSKQELSLKDSFNLYNVFSYSLSQVGDYENALDYAKKSIYLEAKLNSKTPDYNFLIPFFNLNEQYDSSIYFLKKIIQNGTSNPNINNEDLLATTYNNIGFSYYLQGELDSAEFYYKKVINDTSIQKNNSSVYGLCSGNIGQIYFEKKDYKRALISLKIDARLTKNIIEGSHSNAILGMSECYFMLNNYSKSKQTLKTFFKQEKKDNKSLLKGYQLMAKIYHQLNDYQNSALFLRKTIQLNDSLNKYERLPKELLNELSRTRIRVVEKDLILAKEKEKSNLLKNRVYQISLVLSFILILTSLIYFRVRQIKNRKIHQLETELISAELNNKKKDLNNVVTNLSYKRKFIDEIQSKLKELQQKPNEQLKENITLLTREFNSYINADKSVEVLQADIEKVNLSFFNKLGGKFPLLTENEKELCGLFTLKLSSKDIAIIRNVTPNAIKKSRQRIRKKLPILENESITTFLNQL